MSKCPCGTGLDHSSCCEPYLKGRAKAPTAEKLMRSRYSAFAVADIDYIEQTTEPKSRETFDREGTEKWAKDSDWLGLEIVRTEAGGEKDATGEVEFKAKYKFEDAEHVHHERADFRKRDGVWYFVDGRLVQQPVRNTEKIGRNDPCTCGSGNKFKKCCGA